MSENSKSKPSKIEVSSFYAMLSACWVAFLFTIVHFISPSFSLILDLILLPIGCTVTVIWAYFARDLSKPMPTRISLIFIGIYLGSIMNIFLSVNFLANPSLPTVLVDLPIVIICGILIFKMTKKPFAELGSVFLFEKFRYVFLGVSLISLLFAFSVFWYLVQSYLPLLSPVNGTGIRIEQDPSLVINIFKSLFLTGLFSFLERLLRIVEETRYK
jgi:hypothetical protein